MSEYHPTRKTVATPTKILLAHEPRRARREAGKYDRLYLSHIERGEGGYGNNLCVG